MKINWIQNDAEIQGEEIAINWLKDTLKNFALDPVFETCGNFVYKHNGQIRLSGNFRHYSFVFCIDGTEEETRELVELIRENQASKKYRLAKLMMKASEQLRRISSGIESWKFADEKKKGGRMYVKHTRFTNLKNALFEIEDANKDIYINHLLAAGRTK